MGIWPTVAALHQGKPGQLPGKKTYALVVALPKLSSSKKFQCDNVMLIKYTIRGFEMS